MFSTFFTYIVCTNTHVMIRPWYRHTARGLPAQFRPGLLQISQLRPRPGFRLPRLALISSSSPLSVASSILWQCGFWKFLSKAKEDCIANNFPCKNVCLWSRLEDEYSWNLMKNFAKYFGYYSQVPERTRVFLFH